MTLGEFLHPLRSSPQRDIVLAVMYFLQRYEKHDEVTSGEVKSALVKAKHRGKSFQIPTILNRGAPYVHNSGARGRELLWSLTDTGEQRVRELLELPADQPEIEHDVSTLRALAAGITDANVRGYVEEAVLCLRVGALRAATVFLWTGAAATLRDRVWQSGAAQIQAALQAHNPKATFRKKDDFAYIKDATLLQVAQDLGLLDKTQKGRLGEALDLRNSCGHPTKYSPGPKRVSAFIEDVVGIVW